MDTELEIDFEMVAPPADDPETPDIDESADKYWQYKLTFELQKDKYGLLRLEYLKNHKKALYQVFFLLYFRH